MTDTIIVGDGSVVPPPIWPRRSAHLIRDDAEALAAAREVAAKIAEGAAERDRNDLFPSAGLELFSASGLWGITVPRAYGGAEVSYVTLGRVIRAVSAADSSLAQLSQNHLATVAVIRSIGTPAQQADLFAEVLSGKRFGNAFSETGTRTVADLKTRFRREGPDVIVTGVKRYATGALAADLVQIVTLDDEGRGWLAIADRAAPGLTVINDWSGFGQRGTGSGTVKLEEVRVPDSRLLPAWRAYLPDAPTADGAISQFIQAAIDAGLAEGAIAETERFVRTRTRAWIDAPGDRAADDPYIVQAVGALHVRLSASIALLDVAGRAIDDANKLFELAGTASTDRSLGLDRYWRNARTHTLHDPVRWKYAIIGEYRLNGRPPPLHPWN